MTREAKIFAVRSLLRQGLSAREVGLELQCSASAVTGLCKRADIDIIGEQSRAKPHLRQVSAQGNGGWRDRERPPVDQGLAKRVLKGVCRPVREDGGVSLIDAPWSACRTPLWPDEGRVELDEYRVCGQPSEVGSAYCCECRPHFERLPSNGEKGAVKALESAA
ncbi:GcrA family cell cycle regulator [Acuticoccus sp. M5D2P5]|uniref:GcrA family cell cycle regulator n=1 Tax=Acuticoccus kalidii TaxID=2910977 RepID=UPI001F1BD4E8|nr:GcrA family cell cycle regulator [Acuticoccus kalidii]MCF3935033.1 GcrA family cell cycle regulator [Acuticoccus kalidii]